MSVHSEDFRMPFWTWGATRHGLLMQTKSVRRSSLSEQRVLTPSPPVAVLQGLPDRSMAYLYVTTQEPSPSGAQHSGSNSPTLRQAFSGLSTYKYVHPMFVTRNHSIRNSGAVPRVSQPSLDLSGPSEKLPRVQKPSRIVVFRAQNPWLILRSSRV